MYSHSRKCVFFHGELGQIPLLSAFFGHFGNLSKKIGLYFHKNCDFEYSILYMFY